jgi:hypothetical protein
LRLPALLIVLFLIPSALFYLRARARESYFSDREFRLLALISKQFTEMVDNFDGVLKNTTAHIRRAGESPVDLCHDIEANVALLRPLHCSASSQTGEGETVLEVATAQSEPIRLKLEQYGLAIEAAIRLPRIDRLLDRPEVFDDVILAETDGRVVAQRTSSGIRVVNIRDLMNRMSPAAEAPRDATKGGPVAGSAQHFAEYGRVADVSLGRRDYKIFSQPVRFSLQREGTKQAAEFVLCGLIDSTRFYGQTTAIPHMAIIVAALVLAIAFLSLPLLKLLLMTSREQFRLREACAAAVCAVTAASLLALLFMDLYCARSLEREMDQGLTSVAAQLDEKLGRELKRMHEQLDYMIPDDSGTNERVALTDYLAKFPAAPYPFFDMAFWTDAEGSQRIKWTVKSHETPFINIASRTEFQALKTGRTWRAAQPDGRAFDFWFGPSFSPNTGENLAVMTERLPGGRSLFARTLVSQPLSLFRPVLPAGYGFALLEADGLVAFHSDPVRNERENFIEECDENRQLASAVFGQGERILNAAYEGRDERVLITRLQRADSLPWSVAVYRDKTLASSANLQAAGAAGLMLLAYMALATGVVAALFLFWRPRYPAEWLWPRFERAADYRQLSIAYAALAAAFSAWVCTVGPRGALAGVVAAPAFALSLGIWRLKFYGLSGRGSARLTQRARAVGSAAACIVAIVAIPLPRATGIRIAIAACCAALAGYLAASRGVLRWCQQRSWPSWRAGYTLASCLFAVIAGIVPCLACFKVAWEREMTLWAAHNQRKLVEALEARRIAALGAYSGINAGASRDALLAKRMNIDRNAMDLDFFGFMQTEAHPVGECRHHFGSESTTGADGWTRYFGWIMIPANRTAIELRGLNERLGNGRWDWSAEGDVLRLRRHLFADALDLDVSSAIVAKHAPTDGWVWMAMMACAALLFATAALIERKVFFLDVHAPTSSYCSQLPDRITSNLLALGRTGAGKSMLLARRPDIHVIDLAAMAGEDNWARDFCYEDLPPGKTIAIDNFEFNIQTPAANREKLHMLEQLVYRFRRTVLIVSTVNPLYYFTAGASGLGEPMKPEELERWAGMLNTFQKVVFEGEPARGIEASQTQFEAALRSATELSDGRVAELGEWFGREIRWSEQLQRFGAEITAQIAQIGAKLPRGVEITEAVLTREFLDRAGAHYRVLWVNCSREEKLALSHLAENGLVSPQNQAGVEELLRKRLIVRDPAFRIMNDSFRQFLLTEVDRGQIRNWEREESRAGWGARSWLVLALLVGVAAPILIAQRDTLDEWAPSIAPLAGALTGIYKFLSGFVDARSAKAAN